MIPGFSLRSSCLLLLFDVAINSHPEGWLLRLVGAGCSLAIGSHLGGGGPRPLPRPVRGKHGQKRGKGRHLSGPIWGLTQQIRLDKEEQKCHRGASSRSARLPRVCAQMAHENQDKLKESLSCRHWHGDFCPGGLGVWELRQGSPAEHPGTKSGLQVCMAQPTQCFEQF